MKIEELDDSVVILDPDQENSTDSSFTSSNESMPALNDDELLLDDSIVEIGFVNPELSTEEESEVQTSEIQSSLSPQIKEIWRRFSRPVWRERRRGEFRHWTSVTSVWELKMTAMIPGEKRTL